jgi:RNA polymerase sigma factor (sigma-70 family)
MSAQADPTSQGCTERWVPTRQSLLERLKDWNDRESWREFFDLYGRLIYAVARKAGLAEAEAEDVVQETILSVAKKMPEFQYDPARGTFKGWLRQLIGWRIARQFRKRQPNLAPYSRSSADESADTEPIQQIPDPAAYQAFEEAWETEWQENLTKTALEQLRSKINPKHYQIFQLYALQHRPVAEIRKFLSVSAAEVYLAKHRVTQLLKKEIQRLANRCP